MDIQEKLAKAREIKNIREKENAPSDRAPSVEVAEIYRKIADILTDDDKEIFSQLDKATVKNMMVDETKTFATAVDFALNPLPDIEMEFERRGIRKKIKIGTEIKTDLKTGEETTVDKFDLKPINFEIQPLLTFSHEWLKKRHYVNRKRVTELIDLIRAIRMGESISQSQRPPLLDTPRPPTRM